MNSTSTLAAISWALGTSASRPALQQASAVQQMLNPVLVIGQHPVANCKGSG